MDDCVVFVWQVDRLRSGVAPRRQYGDVTERGLECRVHRGVDGEDFAHVEGNSGQDVDAREEAPFGSQ